MGGRALLRIEDTDSTRVRPEHETAIYDDLAWLGLTWPTPMLRQSERSHYYDAALSQLDAMGLIYPCSCTRRQIVAAGAAQGADGLIYPGTCRDRRLADGAPNDAIRLDVGRALKHVSEVLCYREIGEGTGKRVEFEARDVAKTIGDPVLRRKETRDPAYHLACVHDDAAQAITHVVRGKDLEAFTPLHVLLQTLLGYPTPVYHHHGLIVDADGKRLAKIDKSKALSKYRAEGATPADIRCLIGL